jgi:DNA-binding Lrp family transcriptional regulator
MAIGFVMIKVENTMEKEVQKKLEKIEEVTELHPLFGDYDLIAKVEADNFDALGAVIIKKIRTIKGVMDTKTLVGIKMSDKKT